MAFYGIPMFGEGLVSKTLDNTIKGKGASVAQQQLNRGLQQTRRGMMGQAASDRSNPALAVRNAMLAGSQAATDTNMQAAQLRAQEQATALGQRMAQGQQQGQQFLGQLQAVGQGLAGSGVLGPQASAALGAATGLAPGMVSGQQGKNASTPKPMSAVTRGLVSGATSALSGGMAGTGRPSGNTSTPQTQQAASAAAPAPEVQGGNTSTSAPAAPQMSPELAAIYNAATVRSGAPSGELRQPQTPSSLSSVDAANMIRTQPNYYGTPEFRGNADGSLTREGTSYTQSNADQVGAVPFGGGSRVQLEPTIIRGNVPRPPIQLEPTVIRGNVPGPANPPPPTGNIQMVRGIATVPMGDGRFRAVPNPNYQAPAAQPTPAQDVLAGQPGGNTSTRQPIQLEPTVIRGNVGGQAMTQATPSEPYVPPGTPIPIGNQAPLTPEQMAESARRIEQDRTVREMVAQASRAILPPLIELGPLAQGTEPFRPSKQRPGELRDPAMVYQDPNRMVFSYDPQDSRRSAEQYGMQPDNGFGVPPEASTPGTGVASEILRRQRAASSRGM